jgi:SPP1 family predicted phage head-tail adaptor
MKAGDLRLRGVLQVKTVTVNAIGGETITYSSRFTSIPASRKNTGGREFYAIQQKHAEMTDLFTIRFRNAVDTTMRWICDGRTYDILAAADPDGRKRELNLVCREVV